MTCTYKEYIFNPGSGTCQDDGYYVCEDNERWSRKTSCAGHIAFGLIIGIPLFLLGSAITVKAGNWTLRKLNWQDK